MDPFDPDEFDETYLNHKFTEDFDCEFCESRCDIAYRRIDQANNILCQSCYFDSGVFYNPDEKIY